MVSKELNGGSIASADWKPGDKVEAPVGGFFQIDPETNSSNNIYKFLLGAVSPRPIAFVSTINKNQITNLAPFSFYNAVSSDPACLMISIARKGDGEKKDTLRNIEENGQFVVNSANAWISKPLVHCAGSYPYGVSEMELVGLTSVASQKIKPPRVKESAVQIECELHKSVEIGDGGPGSTTLVIGKILLIHALDSVCKDGKILIEKYRPLARLGGIQYALLEEPFSMMVPEVA